jgi:hypothetical protein
MATFLQRYLNGDYIAVWDDLVALGEKVRHQRYKADALAVAAKTMRRARHNVELLIQRLDEMGYRFVTIQVRYDCERLAESRFLRAQQRIALKLHPGDMTLQFTQEEHRSGARATAIKLAAKASSGKRPLKNPEVLHRPTNRTSQQLAKMEALFGHVESHQSLDENRRFADGDDESGIYLLLIWTSTWKWRVRQSPSPLW